MSCRRESYTAKFKRKVIEFAEDNSNHAAAEHFSINRACVIRWRKQKVAIVKSSATRKKFTGPQKGRYPEVEQEVCDFVRRERNKGFAVTADHIRVKALEAAARLGIARSLFRASRGWVDRMMRRNGFSLRRRTTMCQKLPTDFEEKLTKFQRYVLDLRRKTDYALGQIGNADETPVYIDMPRATTVDVTGTREVRVRTAGCEKQRVTVMLCITADGRKLPPYIIFKRKTMPKEAFPKDVVVRVHENGWMTNELMTDWIRVVWRRRPGALLHLPAMLVLDAFRGHLTSEVKSALMEGGTDLVIVPGGMTSILQPLDVSVNKSFKDNIRKEYEEWVRSDDRTRTPTGKIKRAPLSTVAQWISNSWKNVSNDIVRKSFQKCAISNSLDGTEDDVLWDTESCVGTEGTDSESDSSSE